MVIFGIGATAQSVLSNKDKGDELSVHTGWALAYLLGSLISSRVSGGHLNPVITVALSLRPGGPGGSSWSVAVTLVTAQYCGGALAGCLAFLVYWEGITWFEHQVGERRPLETAQIFSTFPAAQVSLISAMFDQFLGEKQRAGKPPGD